MVSDDKNVPPVEDEDEGEGGFEVGRDDALEIAGIAHLCGPSEEMVVDPEEMLRIVSKTHD